MAERTDKPAPTAESDRPRPPRRIPADALLEEDAREVGGRPPVEVKGKAVEGAKTEPARDLDAELERVRNVRRELERELEEVALARRSMSASAVAPLEVRDQLVESCPPNHTLLTQRCDGIYKHRRSGITFAGQETKAVPNEVVDELMAETVMMGNRTDGRDARPQPRFEVYRPKKRVVVVGEDKQGDE